MLKRKPAVWVSQNLSLASQRLLEQLLAKWLCGPVSSDVGGHGGTTVGINPLDPVWIATLVGIVTISSAGVAGVGGGATFAALIVLPALGLPVTLVALLISVEPLIDMGRTALNVNGSMTAGTITSQLMKQTDKNILNNEDDDVLTHQ